MNQKKHYFLVSAEVEWQDKEDKVYNPEIFTASVPMREVPMLNVTTIEKMADYMCNAFVESRKIDPNNVKGINAIIISLSYLGEMTTAQFLDKEEEPKVKMN